MQIYKKLILIASFLLLPITANAKEEMSTLFGGGNEISYGCYGAFEIKCSQLNADFGSILLGGRGGVIINEVFSFGGAGYGFIPIKKLDCPIPGHENERNTFWTGGYGGLFFEYINSSNSLVHLTANMLVGAGAITYFSHSGSFDKYNREHPTAIVFVVEPGIGVELNVFRNFRMYLGASYRYTPNFELEFDGKEIVPNTAFNGLSVNLAFKFGAFKGRTTKEITDGIKSAFTGGDE